MIAPWKYRPTQTELDDGDDWEPTGGSNMLAWASSVVTPTWCKDEKHWTVKVSDYFWASCSCCLFFRGVVLGACAVAPLGLLLGAILW